MSKGYPSYISDSTTTSTTSSTTKPKRSLLDTCVHWIWIVVAVIPNLVIGAVRQMITPGTLAAQTVGGIIMLTGMLMSADAYFQLWSRGPALFPYFEESWLGWGWVPHPVISLFPFSFRFHPGIMFNGTFLLAICFSSCVQVIQSLTFRSNNFKGASIAGIPATTIGWLSAGSWAFDFMMAWGSRNFLAYNSPIERAACFGYIIISIFACEVGFIVYHVMKEQST